MNQSLYQSNVNPPKGRCGRDAKVRISMPGLVFTLIVLFAGLLPGMALAESVATGRVVGKLVDAETGDPLIGANVLLEGTTLGASSDLDGTFVVMNVPPAAYTVVVMYVGYRETRVENVKVAPGQSVKLDLSVKPEVIESAAVVVEATLMKDTEASLLKKRQRASAVSDAISAEQISRAGSGNAADAMSRVTGASVVGGKYVYIRGLGERYSNTQLNGAELPSADPDKKAFQLDLFPSGLLDNIVTIKTFTPDQPGSFSGGIVDVGTKTFPERFTLSFSSGVVTNSQSTGNGDFLTYQGGGSDWKGMDDGTRALPQELRDPNVFIPPLNQARSNPELAAELDRYSRAFKTGMVPSTKTGPLGQKYAFSIGNQVQLFKRPLGYLVSFNYSTDASFYQDGQVGRWKLTGKVSENDSLTNQILLSDTQGKEEVLWGGLATLNYKLHANHEIGGNIIYTQSGESTSRYLVGVWPQQFLNNPNAYFETRALRYVERSLNSFQFNGKHYFRSLGRMAFTWSGTIAGTSQDEPDARFFSDNFSIQNFQGRDTTIYSISPSIYPRPARYFRNLKESSGNINLQISLPFKQWSGQQGKFSVGAYYNQKERIFTEQLYEYWQGTGFRYNGNAEEFFSASNIGIIGVDTLSSGYRYNFGNYIQKSLNALGGDYSGDETITAAFGMIEMPIFSQLRFIGGVRFEATQMEVFDRDTTGSIDENDWLPSLNLVYQLSPQMNLRGAYGRTLARPNFREKAPYASYDFANDVMFQGNVTLKRTLIDNFDLRWEWFARSGEIYAVSGFYKRFYNPIERVIDLRYASDAAIIRYENVSQAKVYGLEVEVRKHLDELSSLLRYVRVGGNFSLIYSEVDIPSNELLLIRDLNPNASPTRPLQGQSPYIVNLELGYYNPRLGSDVSLHYNLFGERMSEVSLGGTPNVFEQPRPMLDVVYNQSIWSGLSLKLSGKNLLDSSYRTIHQYKGEEYVRQFYKWGREFSVGLSYQIR